MRQFLLGKSVAYASGADLNAVADGAIGVFYNKNGVLTATTTGKEITRDAMLVLGRPVGQGGPVVLPIYKNNFSFVKGEYQPATTFKATVVVKAPTVIGDYSLIIVKKGLKFNERNKWTASVHVSDTETIATALAQSIANQINANTTGSGVTATVSTSTITITATNSGVDYEVVPSDLMYGIEPTVVTKGKTAYGDASYITDLANKAAADAGYEYTFRDAYVDLYPNYPLNPLAQPDTTDKGYTIFTLRFAVPRLVKTRDEVVNQIVQVAFPTGAAGITTFETVCNGLADIDVAEAAAINDDIE